MSLPTVPLNVLGWCLRAWHDADAPGLVRHANNLNVWRNMSERFPHPYTLEIAQHWVRAGHIDFGGDNWAIALDGAAAGGCGIHQQPGENRSNAEIGYWLAEPYWGRGVATDVVRTLKRLAFERAEVMRVFAPVHADNPASMRVLEKNGFVREGVPRQSAIKAGQVIDSVQYATYRHRAQESPP
jgi:RimJ/RimL family protein N-acetyltransferase